MKYALDLSSLGTMANRLLINEVITGQWPAFTAEIPSGKETRYLCPHRYRQPAVYFCFEYGNPLHGALYLRAEDYESLIHVYRLFQMQYMAWLEAEFTAIAHSVKVLPWLSEEESNVE